MKVYLGPHTSWFGPYQMAEKILFWLDKDKDKVVYKFGQWLAGDSDRDDDGNVDRKETLLYKFLTWIESKKKRKVKIRIDNYDTWNMDSTLALIVLPMLKQLKEKKHGSHVVELEDVPEHLRAYTTEDWSDQKTFEFYQEHTVKEGDRDIHARWDWVMDEMIWAFEQLQPECDWESKYQSGVNDIVWKKSGRTYKDSNTGEEQETYEMMNGPNHTRKYDWDGMKAHQDRISNGLRLFGRYYQGLWD